MQETAIGHAPHDAGVTHKKKAAKEKRHPMQAGIAMHGCRKQARVMMNSPATVYIIMCSSAMPVTQCAALR